ncbi:MAG: hypothetical protein AAF223_17895, partial [Bacteroidota bacterium]
LFSTALVTCLAVALFSCSNDDEQISTEVGIIGQWTVESADMTIDGKSLETFIEESINDLKTQLGDNYDDQMAALLEESFEDFDLSEEFENTTIEFKEDKTAIVTDEDGTQNGTWSANDKELTITFDNDSQKYTVRSLTGNNASLSTSLEFEDMELEGVDASTLVEIVMNLKK